MNDTIPDTDPRALVLGSAVNAYAVRWGRSFSGVLVSVDADGYATVETKGRPEGDAAYVYLPGYVWPSVPA